MGRGGAVRGGDNKGRVRWGEGGGGIYSSVSVCVTPFHSHCTATFKMRVSLLVVVALVWGIGAVLSLPLPAIPTIVTGPGPLIVAGLWTLKGIALIGYVKLREEVMRRDRLAALRAEYREKHKEQHEMGEEEHHEMGEEEHNEMGEEEQHQPSEPSYHQPHEPTHHQPHEPTHHQPHEPTHHQPHEPTHHQPHEPTHHQPHEPTPHQPHEPTHHQPPDTTHHQPHEPTHHQPPDTTHHQPAPHPPSPTNHHPPAHQQQPNTHHEENEVSSYTSIHKRSIQGKKYIRL
ncbi:hypothetical protein Pcinc_009321 [Petrolisthes cinctipes]|uniref:Uncharacterized protein n=1 Tax=Petrolisthes cinctipes TaxID=88211 RepID=A0AAE1KWG1_PETCI|nr:hypothetical protein Pcinc_009321 [Petrolisthes cinctipes]